MEIELCLDECVRRMRGILILEELSQQQTIHKCSKNSSLQHDENCYSTDSDVDNDEYVIHKRTNDIIHKIQQTDVERQIQPPSIKIRSHSEPDG